MTKNELFNLKIEVPKEEIYKKVKNNWDRVAKPLDGFGKFETITSKIGAIKGTEEFSLNKKAVIVMCADNGVVEEDISQCGQEVTLAVCKSMGLKHTSVAKMADYCGAELITVDIGVNSNEKVSGVYNKKIAMGTKNFMNEPAMTESEVIKAINVGMDIVKESKENGYDILATGEMGIGNTTTSSALTAAILKLDAKTVTGRGAGLDNIRYINKQNVIQKAIEKYKLYEKDAFDILRIVGGFDIAGLVGVFIGGAIYKVPIIIDGVISAAAGLAAERICPGTKNYMIPSHMGKETAISYIMNELELEPVIFGDLAVGEGSGAVMMFPLIDMVMSVYKNQTTFRDIEVKPYKRNR